MHWIWMASDNLTIIDASVLSQQDNDSSHGLLPGGNKVFIWANVDMFVLSLPPNDT